MIEVFCDGGSRGNPGPAAFGFVVKEEGEIVEERRGYLGIATNNVAEYTAVIEALAWLKDHYQGRNLRFYLDSQLAVSQLTGFYKVRNPNIRNLLFQIRTLETNFGQVSYGHIPREKNQEADRLVNKVLDEYGT